MTETAAPPDLANPPPGLRSAPTELEVSLTGRCNLRCRYCFYANEMTALTDLPTERWLAFFAELGTLAVQRVTLTGGEVFTRPDLFALIDGVIANRMRYRLLTNGTLIDEHILAAFAVGKRRLRLDSIQVSLDGASAAVHDASRPPHSFAAALRGLHLLRQAGFPVAVRVTVNPHNLDDLPNIARLLLEELGLPGFSTNEAERMGTAHCHGERILLTPAQRRRAMATLKSLNERYGGRIGAAAGPLAMARFFGDIAQGLAQGETGRSGRGTLCSCGGVFDKMGVLHDGTLVPCIMLPNLTMGTIGQDPLRAAWQSHPNIDRVRQRRQIPLASLPECQGCPATGFCTGGCPAAAMATTGRLDVRDPLSCYRLFTQEPPV